MGLFDFMRDAGEKIFGKDDDKAARQQKPAAAAAGAGGAPKPATFDDLREKALRQLLEKHGFAATGLTIDVEGERVTVVGKVPTQEQREKIVLVLGNTAGIAQVDDRLEVLQQAAPERKEPEAQFYTVKPGDNLSTIAQKHYGKASKYMAIFEANKPMLGHPDKIYPGQVLRLPPV